MATDAPAPAPAPAARTHLRTLAVAALLGIPVSVVAILFTSIVGELTTAFWTDIPKDAGWGEPPWWYVLLLPTAAGALVFGALKLPGAGGHSPLEGLGMEPVTLRQLPSVLLAAMASLAFGMVLGPEAPLTAIGLTLGLTAGRLAKLDEQGVKIVTLAGAFAAIATIFGGPLPSSLLLFEAVAASGVVASAMLGRLLVPGLLAAGIGALLFTGVDGWSGIHNGGFSPLQLPQYPSVRIIDLLWAVVIAAATSAVVLLAHRGGHRISEKLSRRHLLPVLVGSGLLVGLLAILFRAITDRPVNLILFSGEASIGTYATETAGGVLLALVVAKGLAYAISLGAGFRGGPVFPAVALGVAVGALGASVLPDSALTPAVIAGLAAGPAAVMRLPFFGALLATLLGGTTSQEVMPIAVIAAIVGWLCSMGAEQIAQRRAAAAAA